MEATQLGSNKIELQEKWRELDWALVEQSFNGKRQGLAWAPREEVYGKWWDLARVLIEPRFMGKIVVLRSNNTKLLFDVLNRLPFWHVPYNKQSISIIRYTFTFTYNCFVLSFFSPD